MPDAPKRSRKRAPSVQLTASDSTQTPAMPDAEWIPEYNGWVTELGPLVKKKFPIPPEHFPLFDNFIARMIEVGRSRYEIEKVSQKIRAAKVGLLYKKDWNSLLSLFSAPARGHFGCPSPSSSSASTVFPPVDKYPHALALIHQRLDKNDYRLDEGGPLLSAIAAAACDLRCGITVYTSPLMYSTSHSQGNYGTWASFLKCPRDYRGDISACLVGGYKLRRVGTRLDQFFGQDFHVFLIIAIHPPRVGSPAQRPPRSFALFDINSGPIEERAKSLVQWGVSPNVLSMLRSGRHGKVFANIRSPHREDRNDDGRCYYRTVQKLLGFLALGVDGLGIQRDSTGNVEGMVGFRPIDID